MKFIFSLVLAIMMVSLMDSSAWADKKLGEVIKDNIRDEIRDDIRDNVRRDICQRRENRGRNTDLCDTLEDVDDIRDRLRRTRNRIRTLDAIFD